MFMCTYDGCMEKRMYKVPNILQCTLLEVMNKKEKKTQKKLHSHRNQNHKNMNDNDMCSGTDIISHMPDGKNIE